MSLKEAHESHSSNSRGPVHEDPRLQIEELDEWRTHKPRTPDKLNLRQNEVNTFPNQLKIEDRVLLDVADPHIVATTLNEEIPITILSIFPLGTVEVRHPKFDTFKAFNVVFTRKENHRTCPEEEEGSVIFRESNHENSSPSLAVPPRAPRRAFPNTLGPTLNCRPLHRLGYYRTMLAHFGPCTASYNPSSSKASVLPPSLRYLHAILAHTITGRRESIGVVNTHDAYLLWCMSHEHIIDLAYFIALTIQHQTERHRKGIISIGIYVTRLAQHFGLLNTAAQESSLTLIGQMSPQGISSMLSMRMIERHRGTYPPQYLLAQSIEEEA
ncbi:hypothetical protein GOBAR_AA03877 [Gossypium barbadense]|uniref:Uncharacterized protein n=1 Tax=Gossypium barbadense TaxID=3634 RepID=A0A2P5YM86_GOSBA|nr:hypothetical protein GOBAR_AA03877 [Gossypium barbadense]